MRHVTLLGSQESQGAQTEKNTCKLKTVVSRSFSVLPGLGGASLSGSGGQGGYLVKVL